MEAMDYVERYVDSALDALLGELPAVMLTGPRGCGKTTTAIRRASSTVRLDRPEQAAALTNAPDEVLASLEPPVLVDEWQNAPESLSAIKRAVDSGSGSNRFLVTGSVRSRLLGAGWPATGRITPIAMFGLTQGEVEGSSAGFDLPGRMFGKRDPGAGELPEAPSIVDYVAMAAAGGFPGAYRLSAPTRSAWYDGYVEQLIHHDAEQLLALRAPKALGALALAAALNTAGLPALSGLAAAGEVDHRTARAYLGLLEELRVIDRLPAWGANRLARMVKTPKLYMTDPGMAMHLSGDDAQGMLLDGGRLGRVVDTFVMAQLRPLLRLSHPGVSAFHLRDANGAREVDVVLESAAGRIVALEIKAANSATPRDARHLAWLRDQVGESFVRGLVLHTGSMTYPLGERLWAMPIASLWRGW